MNLKKVVGDDGKLLAVWIGDRYCERFTDEWSPFERLAGQTLLDYLMRDGEKDYTSSEAIASLEKDRERLQKLEEQ